MDLKPKKMAISSTPSVAGTEQDNSPDDEVAVNIVKFMNYNIFCSTKKTRDSTEAMRLETIARIIKEADPDVVAVHDVDSMAFAMLMGMLEHRYLIFQVFTDEKDMYGDVLFFHKDHMRWIRRVVLFLSCMQIL